MAASTPSLPRPPLLPASIFLHAPSSSRSRASAKSRDFTDLTISEIQQIAGRAGRRGKDSSASHGDTISLYRLNVITKGLTGHPEAYQQPIRHLLSHGPQSLESPSARTDPTDSRQELCTISAQPAGRTLGAQTGQSATQMEPYGPRVCSDWITQWQVFDHARKHEPPRTTTRPPESPLLMSRLQFLTPGRVVGLAKGRGIVLRHYRSKGQRAPW